MIPEFNLALLGQIYRVLTLFMTQCCYDFGCDKLMSTTDFCRYDEVIRDSECTLSVRVLSVSMQGVLCGAE